MRKATPKRSRKTAKAPPANHTRCAADDVVSAARSQIVASAGEIIAALIAAAKQGNHLQARFLFDFAGLSGATGEAPPPSLAETLLGLLQAPGENTAKNSASGADAGGAAR